MQIWFMTAAAICSKLFSVSDDRPSAVSDVLKPTGLFPIARSGPREWPPYLIDSS